MVLDVIAQMLEDLGCEVVMTTNPRLALDLLAGDERPRDTDYRYQHAGDERLRARRKSEAREKESRGDRVVGPGDRAARLPDDPKAVLAGGLGAHHGAHDRALLKRPSVYSRGVSRCDCGCPIRSSTRARSIYSPAILMNVSRTSLDWLCWASRR